jgi:GNAT superfamily N-acetyltransferase
VTYGGPHLLTSEHELRGFACGKPAMDDWLVRRALTNQSTGTSRTWVVTTKDDPRVAAFYTSATASVLRSTAPKSWTRNQPTELPALLLGRLAVDVRHTGRGLAAALLKHFMGKALEVSRAVGVRVVLVHAKNDDALAFCTRFGFVPSPVDPLTMMMLLTPQRPTVQRD